MDAWGADFGACEGSPMRGYQAGFSLVELLVALALSMLLLLILIQQLLTMSRVHRDVHALLDETMNVQWVFDVLRTRIHHAGFAPCRGLRQLEVVDTRSEAADIQPIHVSAGKIPALLISKMDEQNFGLIERARHKQLWVKDVTLSAKTPVIIADCKHAEVHELTRTHTTKLGLKLYLKKPLVFEYGPEAYVGAFVAESFFFKPNKGLFYKTRQAVKMLPLKSAEFEVKKNHVSLKITSMRGVAYALKARVRIP